MKSDFSVYITRSFRLWLSCLIELGLCLPLWILVAEYLLPDGRLFIIWICGLLLFSLVGVLLRLYLQVVWKRLGAAVVLGALFSVVVPDGIGVISGLFCLSGVLSALQGMTITKRLGGYKLYWTGIALYFIASIVFTRTHGLESWLPLLTWTGVATLALTLFVMNDGHLRYSTLSSDSAPTLSRRLRRHNRIYIAVIVSSAVLLAAGTGRWIGGMLWSVVKTIIAWLSQSEPVKIPESIESEPPPPIEELQLPEVQDPGLISQIMDVLVYVIGGLAVAGLIGLLAYWLYKNVIVFWRKSKDALMKRDEQTEPFQDEEKNVFTWDNVAGIWKGMQSGLSRIGRRTERWEDMSDNRERVRYLYRRLLHFERAKGYEPQPHLTPMEQEIYYKQWLELKAATSQVNSSRGKRVDSSEPLVSLYYRVRYGDELLSDQEVFNVKDKMNL